VVDYHIHFEYIKQKSLFKKVYGRFNYISSRWIRFNLKDLTLHQKTDR